MRAGMLPGMIAAAAVMATAGGVGLAQTPSMPVAPPTTAPPTTAPPKTAPPKTAPPKTAPPGEASARPGADMIEAFRTYQAAVTARDFTTALTAAGRAYSLSKARDGVGGRTGILAYNYAVLILDKDDPKRALPIARDAVAAQAAGGRGLSTAQVQSLLGRALFPHGGDAAVAPLEEAIAAVDPAKAADVAAGYDAATLLGEWFTEQENWRRALASWQSAYRFAAGADMEPAQAAGIALIQQTNA
jgi:hypothetical protein